MCKYAVHTLTDGSSGGSLNSRLSTELNESTETVSSRNAEAAPNARECFFSCGLLLWWFWLLCSFLWFWFWFSLLAGKWFVG